MDVLPLYIVLMVFFPPVLWLLRKKADLALALSVVLYAVTWEFELALPSYPSGSWFFNPYRMAIAVRVRRLVRARRRAAHDAHPDLEGHHRPRRGLSAVRLRGHAHLAFPED